MHKRSGPGPFAGELGLEVVHSQVPDSVTVLPLLMEGEFKYDHGGVTNLKPDLPYFLTNMSRTGGPTCRLRRALVSEGKRDGWRISVLIVGQRAAQLGGVDPPVTVYIK
jgi:hypothetical protein